MLPTVFTAVGFTYALALFFESVNGFHDTAHAAATSIASGVFAFRPIEFRLFGKHYVIELNWTRYWIPVGIACICNFLGAYYGGEAVALFIPKIIHFTPVPLRLIMAALMAAAGWNLFTWWKEIPVSSTHCLIGALTGAGIAAVGSDGVGFKELGMALAGLAAAPFIAYVLALIFAKMIKLVFGKPGTGGRFEQILRWLQVVSSMMVSTGHGRNDGQKTMGIIAMTSAIAAGTAVPQSIPHWIVLLCASCIALGTAIGAGKIIRTVGEKLSTRPLTFHDGLAAETITAGLIHGASFIGLPLSTTQTCTCAVLGAAAGIHSEKAMAWATFKKLCSGTFRDKLRRFSAFFGLPLPVEDTTSGAVLLETVGWQEESIINWVTVKDMVKAWLWTFVATVVAAQVIYVVLKYLGVG
jgi:PiT family inorganic phosphate transporter